MYHSCTTQVTIEELHTDVARQSAASTDCLRRRWEGLHENE